MILYCTRCLWQCRPAKACVFTPTKHVIKYGCGAAELEQTRDASALQDCRSRPPDTKPQLYHWTDDASFPRRGPSLVCSPSMLLFRQRAAAFQPSAPHTSLLFSLTLSSIMLSLSKNQSNAEWVCDPLVSWSIRFYRRETSPAPVRQVVVN